MIAYRGCSFDSETEARWAVFFDALAIGWLHRPSTLAVGGIYLADRTGAVPDFYLPNFHGGIVADLDYAHSRVIALTGMRAWHLDGRPEFRTYKLLSRIDANLVEEHEVVPLYDQASVEDRFFVEPGGPLDANALGAEALIESALAANTYTF